MRDLLDKFLALTFLSIIVIRTFWHTTDHLCCLQWLEKTNLTKIGKPFSWCAEIKRSHSVPSPGCSAVVPSIRRFGRSKRRLFKPIYENSHCHCEQWFIFSCSFSNFFKAIVVSELQRATLLKWNSNDQFCRRNSDHLLQSAFSTKNFRCNCLVFEGPHGGLLFSGSYAPLHDLSPVTIL